MKTMIIVSGGNSIILEDIYKSLRKHYSIRYPSRIYIIDKISLDTLKEYLKNLVGYFYSISVEDVTKDIIDHTKDFNQKGNTILEIKVEVQ